jgi:DNA-binding response OmpR family regulator
MPHLLLVEDDPFLSSMLRALVEARGWEVSIATRRDEVRAIHQAPDLVLLDMQLGAEDGLDMLPDLAAHGARRIVAISADAMALRRATANGAVLCTMIKPVDLDVLGALLDETAGSS